MIGAGVVDQCTAVLPGTQFVMAKLNALEPVFRDVGCDLLVGDFLVFPQDLQSQ